MVLDQKAICQEPNLKHEHKISEYNIYIYYIEIYHDEVDTTSPVKK